MDNGYILGAHNAWSFLPVKKWWMKPFSFMAKCQNVDIRSQYLMHGVRCFDLRVCFDKDDNMEIRHGMAVYKYNEEDLFKDLTFLNNRANTCYIRVLHEVRSKKKYTDHEIEEFQMFCERLEKEFPRLKFWCGRNLVDWSVDYKFRNEPTCDEKYSSVCPPKIIDDWVPVLYAKLKNRKIRKEGTDKDILLIDFVDLY
jgi:hypothetical protein